MSDDPTYVREERTTVVEGSTPGDTVYVERSSSATPWVIAAVVAILAILAILFLVNNNDEPVQNAEDLAAAMEANRAAGYIEGANTAMSNQLPTMVPVPVPGPSIDTSGVERSAAEAAASAEAAREAAERAADSVANPDTSVSSNTTD